MPTRPCSIRTPRLADKLAAATIALLTILIAAGCGAEGGEMAILDIQPRAADVSGSKSVQIHGANFRTDIGYTVYFGTKRAPSVTIMNPEMLRVTTPAADDPGPVDITVLADNGPAWKVTSAFEYIVEAEGTGNADRGNLRF